MRQADRETARRSLSAAGAPEEFAPRPVAGLYGAEASLTWYAIYVKSRHEFVSRDELGRKGIETFLPSANRLRRWKDRKKSIEFPLFPGYVFVRTPDNPEAHLHVLKTRGVVTFVSLGPGGPTPVSDEEINSLKVLLESGREVDIYPDLKEGARIRVKGGPLKSAEGVIVRREHRDVFAVNVELLGRSLGVRVYAEDLESA